MSDKLRAALMRALIDEGLLRVGVEGDATDADGRYLLDDYNARVADVLAEAALAASPASALYRAVGDFLDARYNRDGSERMLVCIDAMAREYAREYARLIAAEKGTRE